MKKKVYEEQYQTLVLFTRIDFFALAADPNNEKDLELDDKILRIMMKNKLLTQKNGGFLCSRIGVKKGQIFSWLPVMLGFSKMCPIYNIPGFYVRDNANPCSIYQKWCKAFAGQFTPEEIEYIQSTSINAGDEMRFHADETWDLMKEQHEWTWLKEIKHLIAFWKTKFTYN